MNICAELEGVGAYNFCEIIENLERVVELPQGILRKPKFVIIEEQRWNPFQRWIDGSNAAVEAGACACRSARSPKMSAERPCHQSGTPPK